MTASTSNLKPSGSTGATVAPPPGGEQGPRVGCYASEEEGVVPDGDGSRYPRSAFSTSPDFASLDSVVETVARARPAFVATSPAVIASPPARAARTEALVAPGGVRRDPRAVLVRRVGVGFDREGWLARSRRCRRAERAWSVASSRIPGRARRAPCGAGRLRGRAGRGAPGSVHAGGRSRSTSSQSRGARSYTPSTGRGRGVRAAQGMAPSRGEKSWIHSPSASRRRNSACTSAR